MFGTAILPTSAQISTVTILRSPSHALASQSVSVVVAVTFSATPETGGFSTGQYVIPFVELDSNTYSADYNPIAYPNHVNATASSIPDQCFPSAAATPIFPMDIDGEGYAICTFNAVSISQNANPFSETVTFNFEATLIHGVQNITTYGFVVVAGFLGNGGYVGGLSKQSFFLTVSYQPQLDITVPSQVAVSVDGKTNRSGSVSVILAAGLHSFTVPSIVQLSNSTQLRFDHWSDGSTMANRTLNLQDDISITAIFVTQYQLNLIGTPANAAGAAWYDSGSTATFSVPTNFLFWTFQGWYENGVLTTSSNTGSVVMDATHTLTAHWSLNLILLLATCCIIATIPIGLIYRKRKSRQTK